MAHGKTLDLRMFEQSLKYYPQEPRPKRERDRSLRGKARVKARKAANKRG